MWKWKNRKNEKNGSHVMKYALGQSRYENIWFTGHDVQTPVT